IAKVVTGVANGDLKRKLVLETKGEIAELADTINGMIDTLAVFGDQVTTVAREVGIEGKLGGQARVPGAGGIWRDLTDKVNQLASYAFKERRHLATEYKLGEGLVGQCALEQERILLTDVPPDYIKITSGLGESKPLSIVVLPVLFEGQIKAVVELASFHRFSDIHLAFLDQLTESIGIVLNTITATMRTEELLKQSQALAEELQSRQAELTETNKRLQEQAKTLQES